MLKKAPTPKEAAVTAVMTALTAVITYYTGSLVPFPATGGYINLGDAMVMLSGLLFGANVGGFAGGVGSALSDLLLAPYYAPLTLLIKGIEGYLAGLIGNSKRIPLRVTGVVAAAIAMLVGYFSVEMPIVGLGPALSELIPGNSIQVTVGAVVSLVLAQIIFKTYPGIKSLQPLHKDLKSGLITIVVVAIVLTAIVGIYLLTGISRFF